MAAVRSVRGVLFVDYVRMLRACKSADFRDGLEPQDLEFLVARIDHDAWYPMATFERFGNAILRVVAGGQLALVQQWGRLSALQLAKAHPMLVAHGDAVETINRFRVMRETFFDFSAQDIVMLHDEEAVIAVHYHMGQPAEEAATYQTLGFFEGLLPLAGATDVRAQLKSPGMLQLRWTQI